jgi:hypothetical protein
MTPSSEGGCCTADGREVWKDRRTGRLTPVSSRRRASAWPGSLAALAEQNLHGVTPVASRFRRRTFSRGNRRAAKLQAREARRS